MYRIGIDLGGTNVKAGITDKEGNIIIKSKIKTLSSRPYSEIIEDMANQCKKLCDDAKISLDEIESVGMGCPGAITGKTGMIEYSNNLNWKNVPMGAELGRLLGKQVKISNDANVAALGEALYGAGKQYDDVIMLTLGTGVGGGIIIGKKLFEGNESKGAELGHAVICLDGEPCTCGRRGCIEAYCSATALIRLTKNAMNEDKQSLMWKLVGGDIEKVSGVTAFDGEKQGDAAATKVVNKYVYYLSEAIMNYCNIFRPQAVVLGGGVCAQGKNLTDRIVKTCEEGWYGYRGTPKVEILTAVLGNDAGILGAAAL